MNLMKWNQYKELHRNVKSKMSRPGYQIDRDNADERRFHVHFLGRDPTDRGFEVVLSEVGFEIEHREGGVIIPYDPMAVIPLERQYTSHKHDDAHRDIHLEGDIANVIIGGWHDLTAYLAENPHPDTDCETLFKIHGHMFIVKRTQRSRNILYHIKDVHNNPILKFQYLFH